MSALFSPFDMRDLTLANRIVVSPMCQYSAENGLANAWHMIHLGGLAHSGAGFLCLEGTAVTPEGRITPGDLGLWSDETEAALAPILAAIRKTSRIAMGIQLAHAGRKGSSRVPWAGGSQLTVSEGGWIPPAPSPIPHREGETPPRALDEAAIREIIEAFTQSTRRAARLGFDAIEIHGAHGYLIHQFLSPLSNHRTDSYGGPLENRMRLALEVFDAVRKAFPSGKPVGMKLSATDWVDGGWDLPQTVALARELKQRGADWITASSAGVSPLQKIDAVPGYQLPFAVGVKATGITTMAVGLITEPKQANDIIEKGQADFVALARAMLYDPRWGWHAAAALGDTVDAPPPYWRATPYEAKNIFGKTVFGSR